MANEKNPHGLKVGQELWFVPGARYMGRPDFAYVTKVGRQWATIKHRFGDLRIDMDTLLQGGKDICSPGRAYLSREIYDAEQRRNSAWGALIKQFRNCYGMAPSGLTEQDIRAAAKLLGVELPAADQNGVE